MNRLTAFTQLDYQPVCLSVDGRKESRLGALKALRELRKERVKKEKDISFVLLLLNTLVLVASGFFLVKIS